MSPAQQKKPFALITGASEGIGRAFASRVARDGFNLIVVARSIERLEALRGELEDAHDCIVEIQPADLTREGDLGRIEGLLRERPDIEMLINNAGFGTYGLFADLPAEVEAREVSLNVVALHRLTAAAIPSMRAAGRGALINVSSMAGFQPLPFNATYAATKAFVTSFTEALYEELRGTGVRVQALCPGFTRTEFQERAGIDMEHLPSLAWMTSEEVVDSSLAALARGGVTHVPGFANRVLVNLTGLAPRSFARRASSMIMPPQR